MAALVSIFTIDATAAEADSTKVDSMFNALDYVLQRPAPKRSFESKRFADHLFATAEGGFSWTRNDDQSYIMNSRGYRAGVSLGDWVTPVYGWRVGVNGGRHYSSAHNPYFVGGSADFLVNFTGLLRGNTDRSHFEAIGAVGLELQGLRTNHNWVGFGARLGMQLRWNATPTTFFFIEPRIGVYRDNLDDNPTWHHYDLQGQIVAGIGYRINRMGQWSRGVDNSEFDNGRFCDNLFISVTGGPTVFSNRTSDLTNGNHVSTFAGGSFGKWFAAPSALRLQVQGGKIKYKGITTRSAYIADIDYMVNINTLFNGYDPERRLELNVLAGLSGAAVNDAKNRIAIGGHVGVQGVWNLSRYFSLYLEPSLRLFSHNILGNEYSSNRPVAMSQISAGVILRSRPETHRDLSEYLRQEREEFAKARQYYISGGVGIFGRTGGWVPNVAAAVSVGKWFTPQSSLRVTLGANHYGVEDNPYNSIFASVDYMASITNILLGFDNNRLFNLRGFIGLTAGGARYNGTNHLILGPEAGLQAGVRLIDGLELFVEPAVEVLRTPVYSSNITPQWRVLAGITYYMGNETSATGVRSELNKFVGIGAGTGVMSEYPFFSAPLSLALEAGAWHTDVSGLRISGHYMQHKPYENSYKARIFTVAAEYMFNFSALINNGERAETVNLIGMIGPAVGWSNLDGSNATAGAQGGVQLRCNITDRLALTLTPNVVLLGRRIYGHENHHRFFSAARIDAGMSVAF